MKVSEKPSDLDYPYVVVEGVRTAPSIAVGMRCSLAYVDVDVEGALTKVRSLYPNITITGVTNYF